MPALQDDTFWAKLVTDELERRKTPSSISFIEGSLANQFRPKPQSYKLRPMVERALRKLKAKGRVVYEYDWSGWALEGWEVTRAREVADEASRYRQEVDSYLTEEPRKRAAARERDAISAFNHLAAQRGIPLLDPARPFQPRDVVHREATLADKLEAKAASTAFPHEAAALRAKAAQLRARG